MIIDVLHISKLANLKLTDSEVKLFEKQLSSILDYIAKLNEVDTQKTEETSQVTNLVNITKNDKTIPSLNQEDTLRNGKKVRNGFFEVKGVFENE